MLLIPISLANRSYKTLSVHGVSVLVISDPLEKLCSAAMSVNSGSKYDPEDTPGLAHFCEHMLFLGTTKYPKHDTFLKSVFSMNGEFNAYTTGSTTCFHYQVRTEDPEQFLRSLDIFMEFFKNPLFSLKWMKREILAIDNEHGINVSNQSKVLFHGLRLLSDNKQFNRFCTGSSETLGNLKPKYLQSALKKYFFGHYKARNFSLVLKGCQSVNMLSKLAKACLEKTKEYEEPVVDQELPFFSTFSRAVHIVDDTENLLRIVFPTECDSESYLFADALINCLNNEGKNTLQEHLSQQGLCHGISCFLSKLSYSQACIIVQVELTESSQISVVTSTVIASISAELVHKSKSTIAKFLSQWAIIDDLNFLYQAKLDAIDQVSQYANNMHDPYLSSQGIIKGTASWSELPGFSGYYNEQENRPWWLKVADRYCQFVDKVVNFDNYNLIVLGNEVLTEDNLVPQSDYLIERHFKFQYCIYRLVIPSTYTYKVRVMGKPNIFVPQMKFSDVNNKYVWCCKNSENHALGFSNNIHLGNSIPECISSTEFHQLWLKKEPEFFKSVVSVQVVNLEEPSVSSIVYNEILCQLLYNVVRPQLYSSEHVGYNWQINHEDNKVGFVFSGFNQGIELILVTILDTLAAFSVAGVNRTVFETAVNQVRRLYETDHSSLETAIIASMLLLEPGKFSMEERLAELEKANVLATNQHCANFFTNTYTSIFIQGNLDKVAAISIANRVNRLTLHSTKQGYFDRLDIPTYRIAENSKLTYDMEISSKGNSIVYFVQTGSTQDIRIRTLTKFLSFFLSLQVYPELRTKQQLGYLVLSGIRTYNTTTGIHISISSNEHAPLALERQIRLFLQKFAKKLLGLSVKRFEKHLKLPFLQVYLKQVPDDLTFNNISDFLQGNCDVLETPLDLLMTNGSIDKLLANGHLKYWQQITSKSYRFRPIKINSQNAEIDLLFIKSLKKHELDSFIREGLLSGKSLSVRVSEKAKNLKISLNKPF